MPRWLTRVQERIPLIRQSAAIQLEHGQQWIVPKWRWTKGRILFIRKRSGRWIVQRWRGIAAAIIALALLILVMGGASWLWNKYHSNRDDLTPIVTLLGGGVAAWVALRQVRIAADRHQAQTNADLQRRVTESFSKAIEQLGNDKLEVRLGGIYALERISQESPQDHWTVMENLTAFVRERTQRTAANPETRRVQRIEGRAYGLWENAGRPDGRSEEFWRDAVEQEPPEADIAATLTVIGRRSERHRALEARDKKVLDFGEAFLRHANLRGADLKGAILWRAHLEGAYLDHANLEGAYLGEAHLEYAHLWLAHFKDAVLPGAHLKGAQLFGTQLQGANLSGANLEGALFIGAHLEGAKLYAADLCKAMGLTQEQIDAANGDAATQLPAGLTRPKHWTEPSHEGRTSTEPVTLSISADPAGRLTVELDQAARGPRG